MTRIVAVDLARFLAVVGMMGAHLLTDRAPGWLLVAVTGFPSSAFAVIGGISAILATRRYSAEGRHLAAALSLAARGAVVAVLGLLLQPVGWPILVVLTYFGTGLIVLALLLRLPAWGLLVLAAVVAVGGPYLNVAVRTALDFPDSERLSSDSAGAFLAGIAFTGTYPVVTWLAYLLIGAAIGRMLVRSTAPTLRPGAVLVLLGAVGLVAATAANAAVSRSDPGEEADGAPIGQGVAFLLDATPHSGSTGDILRTASAAVLVLGLLLLATRVGDRTPQLLRPVRAAGAAPLTIYSLHVLFVGLTTAYAVATANPTVYTDDPDWWLGGGGIWLVNVLDAIAVGGVLTALGRRGPLEALVGVVSSRAAGVSPPRPSPGATAR